MAAIVSKYCTRRMKMMWKSLLSPPAKVTCSATGKMQVTRISKFSPWRKSLVYDPHKSDFHATALLKGRPNKLALPVLHTKYRWKVSIASSIEVIGRRWDETGAELLDLLEFEILESTKIKKTQNFRRWEKFSFRLFYQQKIWVRKYMAWWQMA